MTTDAFVLLTETAASWGLALDSAQLAQFRTYSAELAAWNARVNLTAIDDEYGIVTRHFLDSLACARFWHTAEGSPASLPTSLIDIGSGAGFPGLPLKLLRPELHLTLVESVSKKTAFLEHLVGLLGLEHVTIVTERAEVLGQNVAHRERYDVAVARAVAPLPTLAEYCLPLTRLGGRWLAPKGAQIDEELRGAERALTLLGGRLLSVEAVLVAAGPPRALVVVEKSALTPPGYPRRPGLPEKRPL
jgi:16S rRNA (guanine527-N7)-methyltransferase